MTLPTTLNSRIDRTNHLGDAKLLAFVKGTPAKLDKSGITPTQDSYKMFIFCFIPQLKLATHNGAGTHGHSLFV